MNTMPATAPDPTRGTSGTSLTAVDKAMVVLTLLINNDVPLSLTELARKSGLTKPTVHRLLAVLRSHRMVSRLGDKYSPGQQVSSPDRLVDPRLLALLRSESTPYLAELHQLTGETASISVLAGNIVHHVNMVYGHRAVRFPAPGTGQQPGVFPDIAISRILGAHRFEPVGRPAATALAGELSEIRSAGIARSDDHDLGITCVAVPVHGWGGAHPPVALAITGRSGRFEPSVAARALRRSAFALARTVRIAIVQPNRAGMSDPAGFPKTSGKQGGPGSWDLGA